MVSPNSSQLGARVQRVQPMPPADVEQETEIAAMDDDGRRWTVVAVAIAALLQIYNILACGRATAAWVCPRRAETSAPESAAQQQPRTTCRPLARTEHVNPDSGTEETPTTPPTEEPAPHATPQRTNPLLRARQTPVWQILKPNICEGVLSAMHRWRLLVIRTIQDAEHTLQETEYKHRQGCTHICTHRDTHATKTLLVVCACFMYVCVCEETALWQDNAGVSYGVSMVTACPG